MGHDTTIPFWAMLCTTIAFLIILPAAAQPPAQKPPAQPFSAQIAAIEAVERVYASHRRADGLAPAEAREAASDIAGLASAKARDTRRQCLALQELAGMPVTPLDIQEEIDRWARDSKNPARLQELFDALGGDPSRVAEGLARPILAERRLRGWYAFNDGLHKETRRQAEAARDAFLVSRSNPEGAGLSQTIVFRTGERHAPEACTEEQETVMLTRDEMTSLRRRVPAPGTIGPLEETQDDFRFTYTIASLPEQVEVRYFLFPKKGFSEWWSEVRSRFQDSPMEGLSGGKAPYRLPVISAAPPALCDQWTPTTTTGAPTARYVPTVVWTGSEMIVWGGSPASNTGGKYNPATDSWQATTTTDAPLARTNHTAVWTGSEMIVWGGWGASQYSSGGHYSPAANTWVATATSGAPLSRRRHTAIWTGSVMVVWGGYSSTSSSYLNSGSRYDPVGKSWQATTTTGAPSIRSDHTALWTGTQMVVWGGWDGSTYHDTGAKYDPVGNAWTPTSLAAAPEGRYSHVAVWTGTEMLVWGGRILGDYTDTGGIYTPASDTWAAMSLVGAPSRRDSFAGVWTGGQMIVWGGWISGGSTQTGGVYTRATDSWTSTTLTGAPDPRYSHKAVWTGSEMIVWGGASDGPSNYNTGGIYGRGGVSPTASPAPQDCFTTLLSTELYASYQWRLNGTPIPGAVNQTYTATASGSYDVLVQDAGCQGTSNAVAVVLPCEPSGIGGPPPLRVVRDPASPTGYYFYFEKVSGATGYHLYEGSLGTWYDHGAGGHCALTVTDLGTGEMRTAITPVAGDAYYLVTAHNGSVETTSGYDSSGAERDRAQNTCSP